MIQEAYCSHEVAKRLKEKGFNGPCRSYFIDNADYIDSSYSIEELTDLNMGVWETLRPTHQMAFTWLREVHHIFVEISTHIDLNGKYLFSYAILDSTCNYIRRGCTDYSWKYEDVVEAALKYVLENLI